MRKKLLLVIIYTLNLIHLIENWFKFSVITPIFLYKNCDTNLIQVLSGLFLQEIREKLQRFRDSNCTT